MNKVELNVMELLEYLEEILENAPKVPITGKAMIDTKEFEEVINPPRKSKNNTFHLLNNDINNSYERLKNSPEVQAEMMQMYNQFLDQEDNDLENAKKETDAISENKEDDFEIEI